MSGSHTRAARSFRRALSFRSAVEADQHYVATTLVYRDDAVSICRAECREPRAPHHEDARLPEAFGDEGPGRAGRQEYAVLTSFDAPRLEEALYLPRRLMRVVGDEAEALPRSGDPFNALLSRGESRGDGTVKVEEKALMS